jgi:ankyrin repeat protein
MALRRHILNEQLYKAASIGDTAGVQRCLQNGAYAAAEHGQYNRTALHAAAEGGHVEVVQLLLVDKRRVCIDAQDAGGRTGLHLACESGSLPVFQLLIDHGAHPNIGDNNGLRPLHLACYSGSGEMVQRLLQFPAVRKLVNEPAASGSTPMHLACKGGSLQVFELLVEEGAALHCVDVEGITPLHLACQYGHSSLVDALTGAGVPVNVRSAGGQAPLHYACACQSDRLMQKLLSHGAKPSVKDSKGWTPLHFASYSGSVEVVQQLLQLPAMQVPVSAPAGEGSTPLHLACRQGHSQVVQLLVAGGATATARALDGATPMYEAVSGKHVEVVEVLLAAGVSGGATIKGSQTGLHLAAHHGFLTILQRLLAAMPAGNNSSGSNSSSAGGGVNQASQGLTALHMAVEQQQVSCAEALLAAGASADVVYGAAAVDAMGESSAGATLLHRAVQLKCTALVHQLATPANLSARWKGQTPLHLACRQGHSQVVQLLVAAGADVTIKAEGGATPMYEAVLGKHTEVVGVLLAAGADPTAAIQGSQTGLHVAAHHGFLVILQQFLAAMATRNGSSSSSSNTNSSGSSHNNRSSSSSSGGGGVDLESEGMTALHMAVEQRQIRCAEALLAAGASADKVYGAAAVDATGASIAGASLLHRAVEHVSTSLVHQLATPANLCCMWRGQTPLHLALCNGKAEAARTMIAAGAPPAELLLSRSTNMTLAAKSSSSAIQALLPVMVRRDCELLKQLLQDNACYKQLQQGKSQPAVLVALAWGVVQLLDNDDHPTGSAEQVTSCFRIALEVLGVAGASKLARLVMRYTRIDDPASNWVLMWKVVRAVHTGWLAESKALIVQRRLVNMQRVLALQQQQQQGEVVEEMAAGGPQQEVAGGPQHNGVEFEDVQAQAVAAADAGYWVLFVQHLEQLTALRPAQATDLLFGFQVAEPQWPESEWLGRVTGLCEALLGSWWSAPSKADLLAVTKGVVDAVRVSWQQQQVLRGARWR